MKEVHQCDLCRSRDIEVAIPPHPYRVYQGDEITIGVVICKKCGFVFLSPRMDAEQSKNYYEKVNAHMIPPLDQLKNSPRGKLYEMQADILLSACQDRRGKALEIGPAEGYFLWLLSQQGFDCEGIEPCGAYQDFYAKNYPRIKMNWTTVENVVLTPGAYKAVALRHVLEHVDSPLSLLKRVYECLAPEGRVYIEVPNMKKPQTAICEYFHHQHLSYFTLETLRTACQLAGLVCESIEEFDGNAVNSGGNYSVLRACVGKSEPTAIVQASLYVENQKVIRRYLRDRKKMIKCYLVPLEKKLLKWQAQGKRIAFFCGGPHTGDLLNRLTFPKNQIVCIFDNDKTKWGKKLFDIPIVSPDKKDQYQPNVVVISSREFEDEIYRSLSSWREEGIRTVCIYEDII